MPSAFDQALARFRAEPDDDGRLLRQLLEALAGSTFWVADDGELGYVQSDDHRILLALFTDRAAADRFLVDAESKVMPAEEAIRRVSGGEYGGLIVNPEERSFELSAEDVRDFFEID
jgi:hypothetical protein